MTFERVEKQLQHLDKPATASIYHDGSVRLNAVAGERWFTDAETVDVQVDRDGHRLGFDPEYDGSHARTVTTEGNNAAVSISCRAPLRQLGYDLPIKETIRAPIDRDPESGLIVINLNGEAETALDPDPVEDEASEDQEKPDEEQPIDEPYSAEDIDDDLGRLTEISYVGAEKVHAIRRAGFESIEAVGRLDIDELAAVEGVGRSMAKRITSAIKSGAFDDGESDESGDEESDIESDPTSWISRDAHEIVQDAYRSNGSSSGGRDLREVLDAVEQADNTIALNQRLALGGIGTTRSLLVELGLAERSGAMLDPRERSERIAMMREVFL